MNLTVRLTWIAASALVCGLASLDVLGWPAMAAMLGGALVLGDD